MEEGVAGFDLFKEQAVFDHVPVVVCQFHQCAIVGNQAKTGGV
jgi:hypothetical protein